MKMKKQYTCIALVTTRHVSFLPFQNV